VHDALALYARTFVIGVAVAAPVGAMGVLCMQRTLARGWRIGMTTGLGIATADGLYAAIAAFGMSALAGYLVTLQTPLRLAGGAALIILGLRAALSPPSPFALGERTAPGAAGDARSYLGAVGLTLTNPMTIMAFGAIFASAGLAAQSTPLSAATATFGVATGSLAWWTLLVTGVALARHSVGTRMMRGINLASGGLVAVFGVIAVTSVFITR